MSKTIGFHLRVDSSKLSVTAFHSFLSNSNFCKTTKQTFPCFISRWLPQTSFWLCFKEMIMFVVPNNAVFPLLKLHICYMDFVAKEMIALNTAEFPKLKHTRFLGFVAKEITTLNIDLFPMLKLHTAISCSSCINSWWWGLFLQHELCSTSATCATTLPFTLSHTPHNQLPLMSTYLHRLKALETTIGINLKHWVWNRGYLIPVGRS